MGLPRLTGFLPGVNCYFLFIIEKIPIKLLITKFFLFFQSFRFPICFVHPFYLFFDPFFLLQIFLLSFQLLISFALPLFVYLHNKHITLGVLFALSLFNVIKPCYRWGLWNLLNLVFFWYLVVIGLNLVLNLDLGLLYILKSWLMAEILKGVYELVHFLPFPQNPLISFSSSLSDRIFNYLNLARGLVTWGISWFIAILSERKPFWIWFRLLILLNWS